MYYVLCISIAQRGKSMKKKSLAFGIVFMIVGISIIPSTAEDTEKTFYPLLKDKWLYVGGSGPNNYSTIQDAIDNASNGDTIFVYDQSLPYYENLIINTSIHLAGNNSQNTIIDASNTGDTIRILHDTVTISNFTIRNCGEISYLIRIINCNNVTIQRNILTAEEIIADGICVVQTGVSPINTGITIKENRISDVLRAIWVSDCYSHIKDNIIDHTIIGIETFNSYNTITNNTIQNGGTGIHLFSTTNENTIDYNTFLNCSTAISLAGHKHVIQWNEFNGCRYCGISNYEGRKNEIHFNNFINNNKSAYFHCNFPRIIYRNNWNRNYWDDHQSISPRKIPGVIEWRDLWPFPLFQGSIPWYQFDWFPAQEPYDIP